MNLARECPCCGNTIASDSEVQWSLESRLLVGRGHIAQLPKIQARIFNALWLARPKFHPITSLEMKTLVYADDPSGGPVTRNIISVHMINLKRNIEPFGMTIQPYTGYVLVDLPKRLVAKVAPATSMAVSA